MPKIESEIYLIFFLYFSKFHFIMLELHNREKGEVVISF